MRKEPDEEEVDTGSTVKPLTRRSFLRASAGAVATAGAALAGIFFVLCGFTGKNRQRAESSVFRNRAPKKLWKWSREAYHYRKTGRNVTCLVCPNDCTLRPGDRSICRNKVYHDGKLFTLAYGNPCAVHVDPIEKKPLFHFYPSTPVFSVATAGCNLRCLNCQNWSISQSFPEETKHYDLFPDGVVKAAISSGCRSIAYTYSEPTAFYEYMYDTARLAVERGLRNVWVTNGYINEGPLKALCRHLDAANIDLKSFDEGTYSRLNAGRLRPVLDTLETCREEGVWIEITNLVIPGWTDDPDMIARMCEWLCKRGFEGCPLHFSRFFPMHRLTHLPPTPVETLREARLIATREGMKYVYLGNVPESGVQDTLCPRCGAVVVKREGYVVTRYEITEDGVCSFCGEPIRGVWENG